MQVIPYIIDGEKYLTLRQLSGLLDIGTPHVYQAFQEINVKEDWLGYEKKDKKKKCKIIPYGSAELFVKDFRDKNIIHLTQKKLAKKLREIVLKHFAPQNSSPKILPLDEARLTDKVDRIGRRTITYIQRRKFI